jgi:HD-GYP domain-containing protein (c-di-GMP phosphodiesterase class II)
VSAARLHTQLALKLAAMALLVAALVGSVAAFTERSRAFDLVTDRATVGAVNLQVALAGSLDAPGLGDHEALRETLAAYCGQREALIRQAAAGAFVLVRIVDAGRAEVARCTDAEHPGLAAVEAAARATPVDTSAEAQPVLLRLDGRRYVRVAAALRDARGATAAWAEGYFALSAETVAAARAKVARAAAIAVVTVLLTTLLLYPVIVRLLARVERLSRDLLDANLEMLRVVGSAIAKRDSDTDLHNFRVTIYSVRLAEALGVDAATIRVLIKGAFLHDVGKIGIRDAVLLKPGRLDDAERAEMQRHVDHGLDIIQRSTWLKDAAAVVGGHHEKVDGSGYFRHLSGETIPVLARIFSIADVFDALSSKRPYKEPMTYEKATGILLEGRGTHFDPAMVDAFLGIARGLHDTYAGRDDDTARRDLEGIVTTYFQVDLAAFLS